MDINIEERERGKTIEIGRGAFETKKKRFTILDSPGHHAYVPNMVNGTA
jgi:peptide chain release factor subunit 3